MTPGSWMRWRSGASDPHSGAGPARRSRRPTEGYARAGTRGSPDVTTRVDGEHGLGHSVSRDGELFMTVWSRGAGDAPDHASGLPNRHRVGQGHW